MMRFNISSILLVIFSGIVFSLYIILAIFLLLVGSFKFLPQVLQNAPMGQSSFQAFSLIIIGALVLPMGYFNLRQLLGRSDAPAKLRNLSCWVICLLTLAWLLIVLYTERLSFLAGGWTWLVVLPLNMLSISLPILIIIWISLSGISLGSKRRSWTIFGLGLVLGPILILISEITILIFSLFVGILFFAKNPILNHEITTLLNQLVSINSIEGVQELLIPYITNPWMVVLIISFVSVIVPLVEEFLKPAGTWLVVKKNVTPREGFALGVLSGAGYALFETLSAAGNMGNGQSVILLGRAGTDLLHIFTTGIIGWAMISDWKLKGWFKLFSVYLLSTVIHGLWNGLALTLGASTYLIDFSADFNWMRYSEVVGAIGLGFLSLLMISGLRMMNQKLRYDGIEKKKIIDV